MITFKHYLKEHCKTGKYYKPFNILETKILRSLYENYLRGRVEGFNYGELSDNEIIMLFFEYKNKLILKLLGDVLCKHIPDRKTVLYSGNDIKKWADGLYKLLVQYDEKI